MSDETDTPRVYRRRHRLSKDAEYRAVYDARIKKAAGPLVVHIRPNTLPEHRLGLSVGRRVGPAVVRNCVKRLLREAFRLERTALPRPVPGQSYDLIVAVRPHAILPLWAYREFLADLVRRAHREASRRAHRDAAPGGGP